MRILPEILEATPSIAEIRRNIHAHPELRFEEKRTAELVAQALSSWGIAVYQGLGKTGVLTTYIATMPHKAMVSNQAP
mgnify:CR=1 FL=1